MSRFEIMEFDNDYNAYCGSEWKEFPNKEAADKYCRDESWTGYSYTVGRVIEDK